MEKLTLSIRDKEKIAWAKTFAKANDTSLSELFERYLESLMAFDQKQVVLSTSLKNLKQSRDRPSDKQIESHLTRRRNRQASTKNQR